MAYTNAQLVRLFLGDVGLPNRDVTSGDGIAREFYLSSFPIITDSEQVYVAGALKTKPGDYTIDALTGRVLLTAAPPDADGNVVILSRVVQVPDTDVTEACRQEGLTDTATAAAGEPLANLRAAEMLARSMAAQLATVDAGLSAAWAARAAELRARARGGITSLVTKRQDGYSQDIYATDVQLASGVNPRRRYYGEPDRIP